MGTSERVMALCHLDALTRVCHRGKKLLIFDRGYPSLELINSILDRRMSFVMRVRAKWNLDVDNAVSGSFVTLSDGTRVRVIKFVLPSGECETLLTNLFKHDEDAFMQLYFLRWPVETKFDIVKNKLALENFSGVSENAIRQDFGACMLFANLVAVAKEEAGLLVDAKRKDKDNLYSYVPNTADLVNSFKDEFVLACIETSAKMRKVRIAAVLLEISRSVVPVRHARSNAIPSCRRKNNGLNTQSQWQKVA